MSKSVIETLKELVKANGNQAAAILDALIEALEQGGGGGSIEGQAGQVVVCDGQGGAAGSDKLAVDDDSLTVTGGLIVTGGIETNDNLTLGDKSSAKGIFLRDTTDPTAQYYVTITNGQLTATLA